MPKSKSSSKSNNKVNEHSICVRFIRKDDVMDNGSMDDVAKVTRVANDVYKIAIRHVDDEKTVSKEMVVDDSGVYEWLESTLQLLDADYVPSEQYQFDFPMIPSIIIHHRELHHHMQTIMDALAFQLENWPKRYEASNDDEDEMTGIMPKHMHFNYDSDEETYEAYE